jgi:hypothetical protein
VANHYLTVFNAYAVLLDWKNNAEQWKKLKAVFQIEILIKPVILSPLRSSQEAKILFGLHNKQMGHKDWGKFVRYMGVGFYKRNEFFGL